MIEQPSPAALVSDLVSLLTVERDGGGRFVGRPQKDGVGRVFGGQVIAQALQAAQASAPEGMVAHSLHAYFLRGGREGPVIDYRVEADFDGRSFANRRVVASQTGDNGASTPILNLTASFQRPEDGLGHDDYAMPEVAPPEDLTPDAEQRRKFMERMGEMSETQRALMLRPRPIEMRTVDRLHWMNSDPRPPLAHSWFRTVAPLPDDPALLSAGSAFASD